MATTPTEAVLLVGGKGTRLQSVVSDRPKPMANLAGRPFLEWMLLALQSQGIRRVLMCTGHMSDAIETYFADGSTWDMDVAYSRDPEPLGTAGAVRNCLDQLQSDRFLAMNGDCYGPLSVERMHEAHVAKQASATIWASRVEDSTRLGSISVSDDGEVLSFNEKASTTGPGIVNAGAYILDRDAVEAIPTDRAVSLETEVFPGLVGRGLYAVVGDEPFIDIGTPESYREAERFFVEMGLVRR